MIYPRQHDLLSYLRPWACSAGRGGGPTCQPVLTVSLSYEREIYDQGIMTLKSGLDTTAMLALDVHSKLQLY
jgi:hypothetical protein